MAKAQQKNIVFTERDKRLLLFLWKWKIAPTSLIANRFFQKRSKGTAYNRLLALKQAGYTEVQTAEGREKTVWALTKKGFQHIKWLLPSLKEAGYKSESVRHDLYVLALQLGDFVSSQPDNVEMFSEQQLRRFDFENYPSWVPTSRSHRPDGYTMLRDGKTNNVISIEVELNQKKSSDYEDAARFYRDYEEIKRILWLTPSLSMARRIQSKLSSLSDIRDDRHNFVTLNDFIKKGWQSLIAMGPEKGKKLENLFCGTPHGSPRASAGHAMATSILDTRLFRMNSAIYKSKAKSGFCH